MNAVSPFSLFDTLSPARALGSVAGQIAESAKGQDGLAGAFAEAWDGLDANKDGALSGKDVLGHAVGLRNAVLGGIAGMLGYDSDASATAGESESGTGQSAMTGAGDTAQTIAAQVTSSRQMLIAAAPPALPSLPAARAVENLPGLNQIRAAYATLRT